MHYCSQEIKLLLYCFQEKGVGALLLSGNETGALLFLEAWHRTCTTVLRK